MTKTVEEMAEEFVEKRSKRIEPWERFDVDLAFKAGHASRDKEVKALREALFRCHEYAEEPLKELE